MRTPSEHDRPLILFVDDNLDLPLLNVIAKTEKVNFLYADDGHDALKDLHRMHYEVDAAILDMVMSPLTGRELTAKIRQNETMYPREGRVSPVPVFWYTSWAYDRTNADNPLTEDEERFCVSRVYFKPHDLVEIVRDVKELLAGQAGEVS